MKVVLLMGLDNRFIILWKGIGIVFIVTVVVFVYNALKIQHGSNHFPNQKDDSEKKENDK